MAEQMTADAIATLFARGRREGGWNLTRKQAQWLGSVAQREAERHGCKTQQRSFDGWLLDEVGESSGVAWRFNAYRNGAGSFTLTDARTQQAAEDAAAAMDKTRAEASLREMDAMLVSKPEMLNIRNLFARVNGFPELEAVR